MDLPSVYGGRIEEVKRVLAHARENRPTPHLPVRIVKINGFVHNSGGTYQIAIELGDAAPVGGSGSGSIENLGTLSLPLTGMQEGARDTFAYLINLAENGTDTHRLRQGMYVVALLAGATDNSSLMGGSQNSPSTDIYLCWIAQPEHTFAVDLSQDDGDDGDATTDPPTPCTWTYIATTKGGNDGNQKLGTGLSPEKGRLFKMSYSKATKGVGYFDAGNFILWDTNEVASDQTKCT